MCLNSVRYSRDGCHSDLIKTKLLSESSLQIVVQGLHIEKIVE